MGLPAPAEAEMMWPCHVVCLSRDTEAAQGQARHLSHLPVP